MVHYNNTFELGCGLGLVSSGLVSLTRSVLKLTHTTHKNGVFLTNSNGITRIIFQELGLETNELRAQYANPSVAGKRRREFGGRKRRLTALLLY